MRFKRRRVGRGRFTARRRGRAGRSRRRSLMSRFTPMRQRVGIRR